MREPNGWGLLGAIIADMRAKLVDESWFGRQPIEERHDPLAGLGDAPSAPPKPRSFEESWAVREPAQGQQGPEQAQGIDR